MRVLIIKKRTIISFLTIVLLLFFGIYCYRYLKKVVVATSLPTLRKVIIIDPGHGGIDGGAVGKNTGVYESHINLEISLKLRKLLEESGSLVLMTRDKDVGLYSDSGTIRKKKNEDLKKRKKLFDESNADAIISIHLNSFSESKYYGAQTFYPKNSEKSKLLAELIQDELIRVLDNGNTRKAKLKNDVYILQNVKVPTVLVECGFLSNPDEEKLLQNKWYQEKIAWSIYIGILRYFNKIE
ncbi:N-acetylmuramoyl-L-alanine amidase [Caminicella sporogenes DSM 14501]|uniref:N-acetylmuramoyl-L-alanine amidase n=1 Tax=Caminicella sporogenes DSM 14501 TaxID=1121266 RepID=A0A1M6TDK6_9FIRM|nr:N-acetylmuramoyl-L-alanine amidase CwlD [Caminicella sporogenes]RKD25403.1 N-acetylmuramoyl-L-alanine amidase CwlD [Caminicella sporogenes]WIF95556.1 N-acetylmuramoyl-L-alanine amidase CwlD [Caminicella sporogenes]SHK55085.1 N-acetylmuramoyl-L-alanine amidase [Caminicella sporogenes DSM 14501]